MRDQTVRNYNEMTDWYLEATRQRDALAEALREVLAPWDANCADCADADGFCDPHMEAWRKALTTARAALAGLNAP